MRKLKDYTLSTLIDKQDCAVEAVKLEWLLRTDINERKQERYVNFEFYVKSILAYFVFQKLPTIIFQVALHCVEIKQNNYISHIFDKNFVKIMFSLFLLNNLLKR